MQPIKIMNQMALGFDKLLSPVAAASPFGGPAPCPALLNTFSLGCPLSIVHSLPFYNQFYVFFQSFDAVR